MAADSLHAMPPPSPFNDSGHNLFVVHLHTAATSTGDQCVREIAAIYTDSGRSWEIALAGEGALADDAQAVPELTALARSIAGRVTGGFHPDAHTRLLRRLFTELGLSPEWHQNSDIRQLTAGALGIPPTHMPTTEQTCNLWGVSVRARESAVQMAEAAAACFDALAYFSAGDGRRIVEIQLN